MRNWLNHTFRAEQSCFLFHIKRSYYNSDLAKLIQFNSKSCFCSVRVWSFPHFILVGASFSFFHLCSLFFHTAEKFSVRRIVANELTGTRRLTITLKAQPSPLPSPALPHPTQPVPLLSAARWNTGCFYWHSAPISLGGATKLLGD